MLPPRFTGEFASSTSQSEISRKTGVLPLVERVEASSRDRSSYIPTLDGWRAVAIAMVMGEHSYNMLMNNGSRPAMLLVALFTHGGYGVDIFFGLSGFLIGTLLLREREQTGTIRLGRFYVRRAFRILPPMFLYMACILTLSDFRVLPHLERDEIFSVFFFYRNYIQAGWYTLHFWSLSVEEHFYAIIPLFLVSLNRKRAIVGAALLIAIFIGVRGAEFWHGVASDSPLRYHSENRLDGLLWGVLLALVMRSAASREWLRRRLTPWSGSAVLLSAVLLLARFPFPAVHRTIVAAVAPVMIAYTMLHANGFAGRLLETPLLRWLGRISYGLYIWQMLFCVIGERPLGLLQSFPLALICPVLCAALSYYLLEKPMIRIGHRLADAMGSPKGPAMAHQAS